MIQVPPAHSPREIRMAVTKALAIHGDQSSQSTARLSPRNPRTQPTTDRFWSGCASTDGALPKPPKPPKPQPASIPTVAAPTPATPATENPDALTQVLKRADRFNNARVKEANATWQTYEIVGEPYRSLATGKIAQVEIESVQGNRYTVDVEHRTCTCQDYEMRIVPLNHEIERQSEADGYVFVGLVECKHISVAGKLIAARLPDSEAESDFRQAMDAQIGDAPFGTRPRLRESEVPDAQA